MIPDLFSDAERTFVELAVPGLLGRCCFRFLQTANTPQDQKLRGMVHLPEAFVRTRAEWVLSHGADPNIRSQRYRQTTLARSLSFPSGGYTRISALLTKAGAQIEERDMNGNTLLAQATHGLDLRCFAHFPVLESFSLCSTSRSTPPHSGLHFFTLSRNPRGRYDVNEVTVRQMEVAMKKQVILILMILLLTANSAFALFCTQCGQNMATDANFCPACGKARSSSSPETTTLSGGAPPSSPAPATPVVIQSYASQEVFSQPVLDEGAREYVVTSPYLYADRQYLSRHESIRVLEVCGGSARILHRGKYSRSQPVSCWVSLRDLELHTTWRPCPETVIRVAIPTPVCVTRRPKHRQVHAPVIVIGHDRNNRHDRHGKQEKNRKQDQHDRHERHDRPKFPWVLFNL